jgi:hypothetical protein
LDVLSVWEGVNGGWEGAMVQWFSLGVQLLEFFPDSRVGGLVYAVREKQL